MLNKGPAASYQVISEVPRSIGENAPFWAWWLGFGLIRNFSWSWFNTQLSPNWTILFVCHSKTPGFLNIFLRISELQAEFYYGHLVIMNSNRVTANGINGPFSPSSARGHTRLHTECTKNGDLLWALQKEGSVSNWADYKSNFDVFQTTIKGL